MTTRPAAARRPQQERGQRRVDAILDTTAALIEEEGIAAVSMHRVAKRSGTTTGSMYHFFPDRRTLLRALAERHAAALRELMAPLERDAAARWSQLSTPDAVDAFLDPFMGYLDRHPDLLPLVRLTRTTGGTKHRDAELDALVVRLAEALVESRDPGVSREARSSRAITVMAIVEGMVGAMAGVAHGGHGAHSATALRRELRRALVAYLDASARDVSGRGGAPS